MLRHHHPKAGSCTMILDSETKAVELPEDHGNELRLWLRLLTCTTLIEGEVRGRLRERFDVTLPRFDLMAQLDKVPDGMTLSDVSKRMMVSNGNVTGLVERLVPRAVTYGPGVRNTIDLFSVSDEKPIVVFIHGGYWQALDGSYFSHLAAGLNAHGISVAVPNYDLCPDVAVHDTIRQMRAAVRQLARFGRSLVISGHSAGGHLAACMLATDWKAYDASLPRDIVVAAYAISGLFDLGPLVGTSINNALGLDAASARAAS